MTPRNTKRQRLERAGYRHVAGWVPKLFADTVAEQISVHVAEVERIAETHKPSGRPKKQPA